MRIEKKLSEVANKILVSDLLLYRGTGFLSGLIRIAGRSEYSHAAKVDRLVNHRDGTLCIVETREWEGAGISLLKTQVEKYPGQIDVFRTNPNDVPGYSRKAAAAYMRRFEGARYGYRAVWRAAIDFLPGVRLFGKHDYKRENGKHKSPFCSQLCAMADHLGGGIDPIPHLANRITLPGDLAHSRFYRYLFTLVGV